MNYSVSSSSAPASATVGRIRVALDALRPVHIAASIAHYLATLQLISVSSLSRLNSGPMRLTEWVHTGSRYQVELNREAFELISEERGRLEQQLDALASLSESWGKIDPPNDLARRNARRCLDEARLPDRLVPDADGGVCVYYFSVERMDSGASRRYGSIEFSNDGEVCTVMRDRERDEVTVTEIELQDVPRSISAIDSWINAQTD